jgi:hypothetical protein
MKHATNGWTLKTKPDAVLEWTSPTGRTYKTEPALLGTTH